MSECEEFKTILNVAETVGESIVAAKQLSVDISQVNEVIEEPSIVNKDVKFFPEPEGNVDVVATVEPLIESARAIADVVETVVVAAIEPVVESAPEPVIEHVVEHVVEPVIEHVVEPVIEHVVEPAIEQVIETVIEPVIEHVVEPVIEHVVEPAIEQVIETVIDAVRAIENIDATADDIKPAPIQDKKNPQEKMSIFSKLVRCLKIYRYKSAQGDKS